MLWLVLVCDIHLFSGNHFGAIVAGNATLIDVRAYNGGSISDLVEADLLVNKYQPNCKINSSNMIEWIKYQC